MVCERWRRFENFRDDTFEGYKNDLTIDRIDNNKGYFKENCRWVTRKEQSRNTRRNKKYKGKCIAEWGEMAGINEGVIRNRLKRGWSWEKALKTPVKKR